jgi:hypothetical protein
MGRPRVTSENFNCRGIVIVRAHYVPGGFQRVQLAALVDCLGGVGVMLSEGLVLVAFENDGSGVGVVLGQRHAK